MSKLLVKDIKILKDFVCSWSHKAESLRWKIYSPKESRKPKEGVSQSVPEKKERPIRKTIVGQVRTKDV